MNAYTSMKLKLDTHKGSLKHILVRIRQRFTELGPTIRVKISNACHSYSVNCWIKLVKTGHVDGVAITRVLLCGLKGIDTNTTEI